jgi:GTP cyclohydrolase II
MSNMKYDAITGSGIEILNRVPIPPEMVPEDAQVEIAAKVAAGYLMTEEVAQDPAAVIGRDLDKF